MSQKFEKLKTLLKELFQLDHPDLDFGLYRIMHAKAAEVTQFLERDLLPQVKEEFGQYKTADKAEIEQQLAKAIEQAEALGADPDSLPKVKELRAKLTDDAVDLNALESEVYDHLYSFFRRYYSEGDFLSKRVYKPGVYAIPYEGEEVKLHWANADQYYIKTSEYLRDYAFRLHPDDDVNPMRVHFRLVDAAEGEHGNVKAAEGKDRIFILAVNDFIAEEEGEQGKELVIRFEYRPATLTDWPDDVRDGKKKPPAQKDMTTLAEARIAAVDDKTLAKWIAELGKPNEKADGEKADYSRLHAHLNRYVGRNTFDYFIHKDLGAFLRRELDFYVKNEVMHLDDIENESVPRVEQYLSKIKIIRRIASKIIEFLAQLEDFQKKLWLKKKFVVETNYCITLDRIPEEFYPQIAASDSQREEWEQLFNITAIERDLNNPGYSEPLTPAFLKANPFLPVDTSFFSESFRDRLVATISDVEATFDGILFHSDNFQALTLLFRRFQGRISSVYIDPPYNTDASAIIYKNNYKHSSWLALMEGRLALAADFLSPSGIICVAIDDEEVSEARHLLSSLFAKELGVAVVRSNPQSRKAKGTLSPVHEYALFFGKSPEAVPGSLEITGKREERYPHTDDKGRFAWMSFIRTGTADRREDRPKMHYPIAVSSEDSIRIPEMEWSDDTNEWTLREEPAEGEVFIHPIVEKDGERIEKRWHRGHERVTGEPGDYRVRRDNNGRVVVDFKTRMDEDSTPVTWWDRNEYASANYGASEMKELFGNKPFDFPKARVLVEDCLRASGANEGGYVLDFFAGSGTTAHAVVEMCRKDNVKRQFVLIEGGNHFSTVTLPRVLKSRYSKEWRDGKPIHRDGLSGIIKYCRLESYEDALNNLQLRRSKSQQSLLETSPNTEASRLKEQYMLGYMLNVETEGSQSLLNVQGFIDPTAYKLKVKRPGSDESREVNVDLLETFNWLIGLTVQHIAAPQCFEAKFDRDSENRLQLKGRLKQLDSSDHWFRTVTGTTPDGRKTLVIWRKRPGGETPEGVEQDNLVLDEWFTRQGYSSKDSEFDLIYVNGTNNLENLRAPDDTWKVRLIEDDFHRLMFASEGI
jgi:adenine-specific DNA-methyltransferase